MLLIGFLLLPIFILVIIGVVYLTSEKLSKQFGWDDTVAEKVTQWGTVCCMAVILIVVVISVIWFVIWAENDIQKGRDREEQRKQENLEQFQREHEQFMREHEQWLKK